MTKKEIFLAIANNVNANDTQLGKAMEQAFKQPKERFEQVYSYFQKHPEQSGFCLCLLSGIQFKNPATPEQEFNSKRDALKAEMDAIIAEGEERVSEFIQSTLKGYGDFRLTGYTPDYFYVTLHKDDKPVFGAEWKIYMSYDWSTKSRSMACSFGIGGNFALGKGSEQEMLHIAFARFLTMSQEVRLDKYLLKVWEQADNVWSRFHALCKEYNKNSMTSLFAEAK